MKATVATLSAVLSAVLVMLTGCGSTGGTGDKGYVSSSGVISVVAVKDRVKLTALGGETLDGTSWSLADHLGKPVVVNVWASWCPPCRAEADDVSAAAKQLGSRASFVGLNIRDPRRADALAFERTHESTYPSLYDPSGTLLLAFRGTLPPNALPSTVVIDSQGRVAAIVLGPLPSATTLVDLVGDVEK